MLTKRGLEIEAKLKVGDPVAVFLDPGSRGTSVTGHPDDLVDARFVVQFGEISFSVGLSLSI